MKQADKEQLLARILEVNAELEIRKALYAEYDQLVMRLVDEGIMHETFRDLDIEVVDNFATKNTGWTQAAVKRYCVKVRKAGAE
jgi:hypothetical protein